MLSIEPGQCKFICPCQSVRRRFGTHAAGWLRGILSMDSEVSKASYHHFAQAKLQRRRIGSHTAALSHAIEPRHNGIPGCIRWGGLAAPAHLRQLVGNEAAGHLGAPDRRHNGLDALLCEPAPHAHNIASRAQPPACAARRLSLSESLFSIGVTMFLEASHVHTQFNIMKRLTRPMRWRLHDYSKNTSS